MLVRLGLSLIYLWQVVAVLGHRKQPNMIFILLDDLGWGDVSWHTPGLPTSNMERLAREGLTLEQAYSQQVCTPSRAALLTGKYPFHIGRQKGILEQISHEKMIIPACQSHEAVMHSERNVAQY